MGKWFPHCNPIKSFPNNYLSHFRFSSFLSINFTSISLPRELCWIFQSEKSVENWKNFIFFFGINNTNHFYELDWKLKSQNKITKKLQVLLREDLKGGKITGELSVFGKILQSKKILQLLNGVHGFVAAFYVFLSFTRKPPSTLIETTSVYTFLRFPFRLFPYLLIFFHLYAFLHYNLFRDEKRNKKKSVSRCYIFRCFTLNFNLRSFHHSTMISRRWERELFLLCPFRKVFTHHSWFFPLKVRHRNVLEGS